MEAGRGKSLRARQLTYSPKYCTGPSVDNEDLSDPKDKAHAESLLLAAPACML